MHGQTSDLITHPEIEPTLDDEDWEGISEHAKKLVKGLLDKDPSKRFDMDTLLHGSWVITNKKQDYQKMAKIIKGHKKLKERVNERKKFVRNSMSVFESHSRVLNKMYNVQTNSEKMNENKHKLGIIYEKKNQFSFDDLKPPLNLLPSLCDSAHEDEIKFESENENESENITSAKTQENISKTKLSPKSTEESHGILDCISRSNSNSNTNSDFLHKSPSLMMSRNNSNTDSYLSPQGTLRSLSEITPIHSPTDSMNSVASNSGYQDDMVSESYFFLCSQCVFLCVFTPAISPNKKMLTLNCEFS